MFTQTFAGLLQKYEIPSPDSGIYGSGLFVFVCLFLFLLFVCLFFFFFLKVFFFLLGWNFHWFFFYKNILCLLFMA